MLIDKWGFPRKILMDYNQISEFVGRVKSHMSQNTRLLLIALGVMVVFGIFLQSLIARSLQDSFGQQNSLPKLPSGNPAKALPGIPAVPTQAQLDKALAEQQKQKAREAAASKGK